MKIGLHLPDTMWKGGTPALGPTLRTAVRTAEEAGFDTIAVADHLWLHPILGGPVGNHLEAYTTLGFIAANTERVRLLAMATAASYRPAGLLAKIVTTLDVLSGGRAMLGIGSGDYPEEAEGLGLRFPSTAGERFDVLEDTIRACLEMWEGEHGSDRPFAGSQVQLGRALNVPQSLSRPHPPIMIAGAGEKRTLPLVARYGDACNIGPSPELAGKLDVLRHLCQELGRDYESIEKTVPYRFDVGENGSRVPELLNQLETFAGLGIETVIGWVENVDRITPLEVMGREVIPVVASWSIDTRKVATR
jgi:alkanesulfonate monooxygenase SsuD/methylene tetrahydromethanopterin reductase-like flavin-dependent oxidoreductase (luciferase family)